MKNSVLLALVSAASFAAAAPHQYLARSTPHHAVEPSGEDNEQIRSAVIVTREPAAPDAAAATTPYGDLKEPAAAAVAALAATGLEPEKIATLVEVIGPDGLNQMVIDIAAEKHMDLDTLVQEYNDQAANPSSTRSQAALAALAAAEPSGFPVHTFKDEHVIDDSPAESLNLPSSAVSSKREVDEMMAHLHRKPKPHQQ